MFGGAKRAGSNNLFCKLKKKLNIPLIGIGCMSHIIHNSVETACSQLPLDVETFIIKVFKYFHIFTVRTERLKEFCEFVNIQYEKVLGYSSTRWLALMPAIERIIKLFPALKAFFLSEEKCPVTIKSFLEQEDCELWLMFVHSQLSLFDTAIRKTEKQDATLSESLSSYKLLQTQLTNRKEANFVTVPVKSLETNVFQENANGKKRFRSFVHTFYDTALSYLDMWGVHYEAYTKFCWILLKTLPEWEDIEVCIPVVEIF